MAEANSAAVALPLSAATDTRFENALLGLMMELSAEVEAADVALPLSAATDAKLEEVEASAELDAPSPSIIRSPRPLL